MLCALNKGRSRKEQCSQSGLNPTLRGKEFVDMGELCPRTIQPNKITKYEILAFIEKKLFIKK